MFSAGKFIGCDDNVKSEQIPTGDDKDDKNLIMRQKCDKTTKTDKATKGV